MLFVVVMAASLRKRLVLEMEGGNAGALEGAGGRSGVDRVAVTGIGVRDHRHLDHVHHGHQPIDDRADRDKAEVGNSRGTRDSAAAA